VSDQRDTIFEIAKNMKIDLDEGQRRKIQKKKRKIGKRII
jgi:hypothetical protein